MCGVAGYFVQHPTPASRVVIHMLLAPLELRGPDDAGVCLVSRADGTIRHCRCDRTVAPVAARLPHFESATSESPHDLALIHTRYAVVDLSEGGHQPFASRDGSVLVVFHGEIYNYVELRDELRDQGVTFRTASDTEVLVEGYRAWRDALWPKLNGFWAVAVYDAADHSVTLSRDRLGIAPLYYRETPGGFYFASSIRSLL